MNKAKLGPSRALRDSSFPSGLPQAEGKTRPRSGAQLKTQADRRRKRDDCERTVTTALNYQRKGADRILKAGEKEGCAGGIKEHFVF